MRSGDPPLDPNSSRRAPARRGVGHRLRRTLCIGLAPALLAAVAGCSWGGGEEPPPPDTVARLTLIAMEDVNPNVAGVPSPMVVVYYELAERQAFDGAEFSDLFYDDGSALGDDVKERLEFRVEPGQIIRTNRILDPETRHLGFVAGYREIERAQWRIAADVEPATTRDQTLVVGARSLSLPDALPGRAEPLPGEEEDSSGWLDELGDFMKGVVDAVVPGSE